MTESETAVNELRLALGEIDYQRALRALIDLQKTGTIGFNRAGQLSGALGVVRNVVNSLTSKDLMELATQPKIAMAAFAASVTKCAAITKIHGRGFCFHIPRG